MNTYNLLAGIWMIALGLILDIYMLFLAKKFNAPWKILIVVFLTNVIAFILWEYIPDKVMPHSLGCLIGGKEGYIWDKNEIRNITVIINSLYGAFWCIFVSVIKILRKEKVVDNIFAIIVSLLIIYFMAMVSCVIYHM